MAVRAMGVLKRLRSLTILDATDRDITAGAKLINDVYGATVQRIGGAEIAAAFQKASAEEGRRYARKWAREAVKVVEPNEQTLNDSGRLYVAMRNLMEEHNTPAITVDCLSLFYAGKLPAYPCLGFFELNNQAKIGACEGDLASTLSMVLLTELTGRPGYISDPVIDTAKNQIIYAHCVSTNRVFGPDGPANPYYIRDHSEDRKGAAVRSVMPVGEMTTTLKFDAAKKAMILHQGKSVDNIEEDKACRTKLAVEVKDTDKLMGEWDKWGWHRVTFYGDLKPQAYTLARLLGFQIVEEG
jgi:L-fucose isomerase-like protein